MFGSDALYLQFKYEPSHPYAPIHEIVEGRNERIKEFYWRLWFGDDEEPQDLDVRDKFTGPEVIISANDVEAFCAVVGNQQEKFKADGDLLKLVHLSNGFKMIPGSRPLKAGDVCRADLYPSLLNIILRRIQILPFISHLLQMGPIQRSLGTSTPFTRTPTLPPCQVPLRMACLPVPLLDGMWRLS
jgi:hypothetical protein